MKDDEFQEAQLQLLQQIRDSVMEMDTNMQNMQALLYQITSKLDEIETNTSS